MPRPRKHNAERHSCFATVSLPAIPDQFISSMAPLQQSLPALPLAAMSSAQTMLGQVVLKAGDALSALWDAAPSNSTSMLLPSPVAKSPAGRLREALSQGSYGGPTFKSVAAALLPLGGLVGAASNLLSPTGPGGCDHNPFERCANCVTSAPYVLVGVHAIQNRKTTAGKVWGASMCGVGMASVTFHASQGKWRTLGRRLDYWSIALSSSLLTRAVYPNVPPMVTAAGIALTPFKPFLVSFLNSAAMELKFLQRAMKNEKLRRPQQLHAATCLLGLGAFFLEDLMPELPLVHSAWHCLSAVGVSTVNHLLADVEESHKDILAHRAPLAITAA